MGEKEIILSYMGYPEQTVQASLYKSQKQILFDDLKKDKEWGGDH